MLLLLLSLETPENPNSVIVANTSDTGTRMNCSLSDK